MPPPDIAQPGLIFYPAIEERYLIDPRTKQYLRITGFFMNVAGHTLFAALSASGSLRDHPDEAPVLAAEASA